MTSLSHYFSLQYSAIQKTVLRHDRLWSMAGTSFDLARLNEITFKSICEKITKEDRDESGNFYFPVLVAGGGKFTARFPTSEQAELAKKRVVKVLATNFPMVEFQVSEVQVAASFSEIKFDRKDEKGEVLASGVLSQLKIQKNSFRGYGVSFNPHLTGCSECGEYPAVTGLAGELKNGGRLAGKAVCRICDAAKRHARLCENEPEKVGWLLKNRESNLTTLEQIYSGYLTKVPGAAFSKLALNFEDLLPKGSQKSGRRECSRMAVWCSDLNNMKQKVTIWLAQDEKEVPGTFNEVKAVNIEIIANALAETFSTPGEYLPFRLVVAGGDDLCLVMPEKSIMCFVRNLSNSLSKKLTELESEGTSRLSSTWLNSQRGKNKAEGDPLKPYCFGGSFVVASLHTPFRRIHEACEALMSDAKKQSRMGNSVNWRILAEAESVTDKLLEFEKPLFIANPCSDAPHHEEDFKKLGKLAFETYGEKIAKYAGISTSHVQEIVARMIELNGKAEELDRSLKRYDSTCVSKSFSEILTDPDFRDGSGNLLPHRLATLFELMSIERYPT